MKRAEHSESTQIKKRKNSQCFKEEYCREWPCLKQSRVSQNHVFCEICGCDFSVAHGGRDDCRRHVNSNKHNSYMKVKSSTPSVSSFYSINKDLDTIRAESYFTRFVIEHNLPISATDHVGKLFKKMFPDSAIAKQYGCARTKTTAIVNVMADDTKKNICEHIINSPFAVATDASNDNNDTKLYPLVVTYFEEKKGEVVTSLLSLLESTGDTGEAIFMLINGEFERLELKWENCLAFSCDNASNMVGHIKGVSAFLKQKQPNIQIQGCPCHLIHIAAQKASKELKIDIEMLLINIFYYLEKSSKRKKKLKICQTLCEQKPHKILKHVTTRWLSLENCLNRLLEQWPSLTEFFSVNSEEGKEDKNKQFKIVKKALKNPETKLYCLFLHNTMSMFTKVNVILQKDAPCIHILKKVLVELFTDLLVRFLKPVAVSKSLNLFDIDYKRRKHQKSNEDLVIGSDTRMYIAENTELGEFLDEFYNSVRRFYQAGCDYILKKFPIHDEFLEHAKVAEVSLRQSVQFNSVLYFTKLFPHLVGKEDLKLLEVEFVKYQVDSFPQNILENPRVDVAWHNISQLKDAGGSLKYQVLPCIMKAILVVPHSNAMVERIFSMVRKNQTEFRSSLGTKTLESLLVQKLEMGCCFEKEFSIKELQMAKKAAYNQNTQK